MAGRKKEIESLKVLKSLNKKIMSASYPTDLTNDQWSLIKPLLPPVQSSKLLSHWPAPGCSYTLLSPLRVVLSSAYCPVIFPNRKPSPPTPTNGVTTRPSNPLNKLPTNGSAAQVTSTLLTQLWSGQCSIDGYSHNDSSGDQLPRRWIAVLDIIFKRLAASICFHFDNDLNSTYAYRFIPGKRSKETNI